MTLTGSTTWLAVDDDTIRKALEHAEVPALLPAVAYVTGDLSVLRADLRPDPNQVLDPMLGLTDKQVAEARELAFEALVRFRDSGNPPPGAPSHDVLQQMIDFVTGGTATDEHLPLFEEELAVSDDPRAPNWHKDDIAPETPFVVGIVGAGMSGLVAAYRLQQAGVPFVVFEKNSDVGGTWFENIYPGCRVDVSNHFYSYSFVQKRDWPEHFSTRDVLLDYFRRCADTFGVREHIRFNTEVTSASFDDERCTWTVCLRTADGGEETVEVQALISAVGQLNRPSFPDIGGRERFEGPWFHSAEWDYDVPLDGKKVVVIGTGASAAQFIPVVAEQAAELTVFQRTAPWLVPTPNYHDEVSEEMMWLFTHLPSYEHWYRLFLFWRSAEGLLPFATVDPDWEQDGSVSAQNDMLRQLLTAYLQMEFADRPDLLEKVIPDYPPAAKRVIRDNGIWARTLKRDNVELVTTPIAEITSHGIRTVDGVEHEADVLIYGTGFQASRFLTPMKVVGRRGVDLHEQWDGDARAYLGITVPRFPNLFLLYGPNTNIVINGSIIFFSECEVHYVTECIRLLLERDKRALDCRPEVHDAYNVRIDEDNLMRAWGASSVNTWYKNEKGRVTQNWPYSLLDYWHETREPNLEDYELL